MPTSHNFALQNCEKWCNSIVLPPVLLCKSLRNYFSDNLNRLAGNNMQDLCSACAHAGISHPNTTVLIPQSVAEGTATSIGLLYVCPASQKMLLFDQKYTLTHEQLTIIPTLLSSPHSNKASQHTKPLALYCTNYTAYIGVRPVGDDHVVNAQCF
jgi:hypothetical protein